VALTERLALLVDARVDGAVRDIKTLAKESAKTDDHAKKLESRGKAIGTAWKVGIGVAAAAAMVKLGKLSKDAVADASALGEQQSKTNVVFGKAAAEVRKFGETAAESLNLSEREALSATSTFGQFFDAAGLATDAGADMSMTMVKLAADMASFQDADPSEVLDNLRSGLSGESEPLRKFGVFLNEAAVAAKAAELGLDGVNGKLTDGEKIQARYAIIMEQTVKQQGDLARTGESLANMQRKSNALMENASAALGEGLLPAQLALTNAFVDAAPAISAVAKGTGNLVEGFVALPGPIQAVGGGVTIASAGFLLLAPRIKETRELLKSLSVESPKAARALGMVGKAALSFAAIQLLDSAIDSLQRSMRKALPGTEKLAGQLLDLRDAKVDRLGQQFHDLGDDLDFLEQNAKGQSLVEWIPDIKGMVPGLTSAGERIHQLADETAALDSALASIAATSTKDARAAFDALAASEGLSSEQQKALLRQLPQYTEALAGTANQARLAGTATDGLTGATEGNTDATDENTDALVANINKMREKRSEAIRAANAEINYQASIDDARQSLKDNGKTLDITTEKGRANKSALLDMAAAWNDLSNKEKNSLGARKAAIDQFVDLATKMGMSEDKARALARRILEIPSKRVEVTLDTSAAWQALDTFISKASGRRIVVGLGVHAAEAKADGGPVSANRTYLVGERGPELFTPRQSGSITPNHALARSSGGGGRLVDNSVATYAKSLAKASVITEKHAATLLKSASEIRDGIRAKIKSLVEERTQVASSFASSFGQTVFGSEETSIEGILGLAGKQASDALNVKTAIAALIDKGVSESVLQDLASSGPSGWDQIKALAGADKTQLAEFNKLTQIANNNLLAAGNMVGGSLLNDDIAAAKRAERQAAQLAAALERALDKRDKNTVIHFHLSAHEIQTTLLKLKRTSGSNLGLA